MTRFVLPFVAIVLLFSSASADTLVYRDLTHTSLGSATLGLSGPDTLIVGSIGSSGLDGVSIDLPTACFYRARWVDLPPHEDGDLLRMNAYGELGEFRGFLALEGTGPDLEITVDLPPDDLLLNEMWIYGDIHTVYQGLIAESGAVATVERWPDEVRLESVCTDVYYSTMSLVWGAPVLVTIPGHGTVIARGIEVVSEAFSSQFEEFRIEAAGIASLAIVDSEYALPGGAADEPPTSRLRLGPSIPNPFNAHTEIHYSVSEPSHVSLVIYDAGGRRVKTLLEGHVERGDHRIVWDGRDDAGRRVASGAYFTELRDGNHSETDRIVLVK